MRGFGQECVHLVVCSQGLMTISSDKKPGQDNEIEYSFSSENVSARI